MPLQFESALLQTCLYLLNLRRCAYVDLTNAAQVQQQGGIRSTVTLQPYNSYESSAAVASMSAVANIYSVPPLPDLRRLCWNLQDHWKNFTRDI